MKIFINRYDVPEDRCSGRRISLISLLLVIGLSAIGYEGSLPSTTARAMAQAGDFFAETIQDHAAFDVPNQITATTPTRRVFVRSKSLLVRAAVVEDKLLKRPEFKQLGFVITREESDADLILELRHDLLTKYVFSVVEVRSQTVLASGKVSSLGGTVAGKVAKRFVKDMMSTPAP